SVLRLGIWRLRRCGMGRQTSPNCWYSELDLTQTLHGSACPRKEGRRILARSGQAWMRLLGHRGIGVDPPSRESRASRDFREIVQRAAISFHGAVHFGKDPWSLRHGMDCASGEASSNTLDPGLWRLPPPPAVFGRV